MKLSIQDYLLQNNFTYSEEDRAFVHPRAYIPVEELAGKDILHFQEKYTFLVTTVDREEKKNYLLEKYKDTDTVRMYRHISHISDEDHSLIVHSPETNGLRSLGVDERKAILLLLFGVLRSVDSENLPFSSTSLMRFIDERTVKTLQYYLSERSV